MDYVPPTAKIIKEKQSHLPRHILCLFFKLYLIQKLEIFHVVFDLFAVLRTPRRRRTTQKPKGYPQKYEAKNNGYCLTKHEFLGDSDIQGFGEPRSELVMANSNYK